MSLHSSSSVNGESSTPKDPLYKILDELRSLKLWKEKQDRKEKGKKRVEEISQDEKEKMEGKQTLIHCTNIKLNKKKKKKDIPVYYCFEKKDAHQPFLIHTAHFISEQKK